MMKFKKIKREDRLYLTETHFSNGHWLVDIQWLKSLKVNNALGMRALLNALARERVNQLSSRIQGVESEQCAHYIAQSTINGLLNVDLRAYKYLDRAALVPEENTFFKDTSYAEFKVKNGPKITHAYAALFFFDQSAQVMFIDDKKPLIIVDNEFDKNIVAMLMPCKK